MTWSGHGKRTITDREWYRLRNAVLKRDKNLCGLLYSVCTGTATECDHIEPVAERPDLQADLNNLMAVCKPCHRVKTEEEKKRGIKRAAARAYMPKESHPGLLP